MKFTPRYYQTEAHDAAISWCKKTTSPCLLELSTGAGKSLIIAMLAESLHAMSGGKRILCLAPSAELIQQNSDKFSATGYPYSIYSASISKSLRHPVIFATEGTFKKVAKRLGSEFAAVIIDECHKLTPTIKNIIEEMREGNPNLRIIGLTATPYRTDSGFIFAEDHKGKAINPSQARDPYFTKQVYYIGAPELINLGYLTKPVIGEINAESYDTSNLVVQSNGSFSAKSLDQAFAGWGRETSLIVADIVAQSQQAMGVMIFAATVKHAQEIMASLPPELSRFIGGTHNTKKAERAQLVGNFKKQRFKYLVSVGTMTTGVDFTHVDIVAIMRATESVSLFQQVVGRGLRLHEDKKNCLILDYANNIEKLCTDQDLFTPEIKAPYHGGEKEKLSCECEYCGNTNDFSARQNDDGLEIDDYGYFIDLEGNRIKTEHGAMPAHFGRRCYAQVKVGHTYQRCDYYWSCKDCPVCEHKNDITARYCEQCKHELINPNDKLIADFTAQKKDPRALQTDELLQMDVIKTVSRAGAPMLRVEMETTTRRFAVFLMVDSENAWLNKKYLYFYNHTHGGQLKPRTVTYKKEDSGMFDIKCLDAPTDRELLLESLKKGGYVGEV